MKEMIINEVSEGVQCYQCEDYIGGAIGYPRLCNVCNSIEEGKADEEKPLTVNGNFPSAPSSISYFVIKLTFDQENKVTYLGSISDNLIHSYYEIEKAKKFHTRASATRYFDHLVSFNLKPELVPIYDT